MPPSTRATVYSRMMESRAFFSGSLAVWAYMSQVMDPPGKGDVQPNDGDIYIPIRSLTSAQAVVNI